MRERILIAEFALVGLVSSALIVVGVGILTGAIVPQPLVSPQGATLLLLGFAGFNALLRFSGDELLRQPLSRAVWRVWMTTVTILFLGCMAYGAYNWPDAPLRIEGGVFRGKSGKLHTTASYLAFCRWEATLLCWAIPFAMLNILTVAAPAPQGATSGRTRG